MALSEKAIGRVASIFERAELGDPRRVRRAVGLAEALALAPHLSLPKVWSTPSELEAAYRFLRNRKTDFSALMEPVQLAAREAALAHGKVLVLHDTTEIDCPSAMPDEVGHLQTGRAGIYVHHAFCVGADAFHVPLGVPYSLLWGRAQRTTGRSRKISGPELAKLEMRESDRWLEGVTEASLWTQGCSQVVHVMDSEADSFRLFEHMHKLGADYVIRMRHDRLLEDQEGRLAEALAAEPVTLQRLTFLSARKQKTMPSATHQGRPARHALLKVRSRTVEIKPPRHLVAESITLNVMQVLEENPPAGQEPIAWVIATSLPLKSRAQIECVIDFYRARWLIEEFHKALKTGCMFEKRQLKSFESITSLLALCYPIACELLRVRTRSRQTGIRASQVLRRTQLDCLRAHPKARPLGSDPSAEEALAVIAGLGGHIKYNGPPGWQTLAAGYMELLAFERGWIAALAKRKL